MQKWKYRNPSRLLTGIRYFSLIMIVIFIWMTLYTWRQNPENEYFAQKVERTLKNIAPPTGTPVIIDE